MKQSSRDNRYEVKNIFLTNFDNETCESAKTVLHDSIVKSLVRVCLENMKSKSELDEQVNV